MTTIQVLRKARALVKKGWTQGCMARSAKGNRITPFSPKACRFCAWGAIESAAREGGNYFPAYKALERIVENVPRFNDAPARTQRQVLAAFDRAIKSVAS